MHLNVGVFGSQELAASLGKKDTVNDIAFYSHSSSEGIFSFIAPASAKIQPFLQVLHMIDFPVLVVKELNKEVGEMIIGIDEMKFERGFIITEMKDAVLQFIKGTSLEKFEFIEEAQLRARLLEIKTEVRGEGLYIPVDNYFNVKGIGAVVLAIVKSGTVHLHDKLMLEPLGKEVAIKGVQSHDKDIQEAEAGTRVGLNLKGVEADEIKRGYVLCKSIDKSSDFRIKFSRSRFFKQEVKAGINVLLSIGLQVVACNIESIGDEIVLKAQQPMAYRNGERCIVASQNEIMPRIIGSGVIL